MRRQLSSCPPVVSGTIYRFIDGQDSCVVPMDPEDIEEKLNDPFAQAVLRQGNFPDSAQAISDAIRQSDLDFDQTSYVVGEGSQVPLMVADRDKSRSLRYVVTWNNQIMLSVGAPASQSSFHQVISWDDRAKVFNYYERMSQVDDSSSSPLKVWVWAGNSPLARQPQTMGHGCFDCHHNGVPIMKELESPWNNWQSELASITEHIVPKLVANESFFQDRSGADILEKVIKGNFQKYYRDWLDARYHQIEDDEVKLTDVNEMLRHVITNTTVNLASVRVQSKGQNTSPPNANVTNIPALDTFLWDSILKDRLNLDYQPLRVTFNRESYDDYLQQHEFALVQKDDEDGILYEENGSTYFAYFVPQVAAEDSYMTKRLLNKSILTDKFVAAVAMVDFQNPLFSEKRASLQKYANEISDGTISGGISSVPTDFAKKVQKVASPCSNPDNFDACTAEKQFLYTWNLSDDQWRELTAKRLTNYVKTINNLQPSEQLDYLMQLSVKRRDQFVSTPLIRNLFEFNLLIPETNLGDSPPNLLGN